MCQQKDGHFLVLPRDAISLHARYMLSYVRPPSVCPSVTSRYCIDWTGRIELVFGTEASFHVSHTVLYGNLGISKNYGKPTSLWDFCPKLRT